MKYPIKWFVNRVKYRELSVTSQKIKRSKFFSRKLFHGLNFKIFKKNVITSTKIVFFCQRIWWKMKKKEIFIISSFFCWMPLKHVNTRLIFLLLSFFFSFAKNIFHSFCYDSMSCFKSLSGYLSTVRPGTVEPRYSSFFFSLYFLGMFQFFITSAS